MIERQNWLDVQAYLSYAQRVLQLDDQTVKRKRTHLRHLVEWANNTLFEKARGIDPTFPAYLVRARNDGQARPLSAETMARACEEARRFFGWARAEFPNRYRTLSISWIATVKPDRAHGSQSELHARVLWNLEDVLKITRLNPESLTERRDIAATCLLFLSGMRIDAFITLPLDCIDVAKGEVRQLPGKGVRTKNHKAAVTYLLDGQDLAEMVSIVRDWDGWVREDLPDNGLWYAFLSTDGEIITDMTRPAGIDRASLYRKGLKRLCKRAGVEYKSPHKLRHGHAVYGIKNMETLAQLKAISQNLMHKSLTITDGLYGVLTGADVGANIRSLGQKPAPDIPVNADFETLKTMMEQILKNQSPSR